MRLSAGRSRIAAIHDRLALLLAVLVPLTALPLASNRATWWLIWTAALSLIALAAALRLALSEPGYSLRVLQYRRLLAFIALLPLWAMVQSLPIADYLPAFLTDRQRGPSTAISVQPEVALSGALRFIGYLLLLALVIEIASRRERMLRVAQVVFAGVCLQAVWAVVALKFLGDFSPWGEKIAYLGSATGTFVNRNSLATFLGFGLVLGLGILWERSQHKTIRMTRKVGLIARLDMGDTAVVVGMLFLFIGLIYTQSRLGLTASVFGFVVTLALLRAKAGTGWARLLAEVAGLGVLLLASVAIIAAGEGVAERVLFLGNESVNRLTIYRQTLTMIAERPLTGFGMDAFGMAFEAYRGPPLLSPVTYDLAHNSYLMLWSEFGVIIGSVPILALLAVAVLLWRRMHSDDGLCGFAAAGLGAIALGGLHSLGDFSLEIPANNYLFVLILGLGLGQQSRRRSARSGPETQTAATSVEPLLVPMREAGS